MPTTTVTADEPPTRAVDLRICPYECVVAREASVTRTAGMATDAISAVIDGCAIRELSFFWKRCERPAAASVSRGTQPAWPHPSFRRPQRTHERHSDAARFQEPLPAAQPEGGGIVFSCAAIVPGRIRGLEPPDAVVASRHPHARSQSALNGRTPLAPHRGVELVL